MSHKQGEMSHKSFIVPWMSHNLCAWGYLRHNSSLATQPAGKNRANSAYLIITIQKRVEIKDIKKNVSTNGVYLDTFFEHVYGMDMLLEDRDCNSRGMSPGISSNQNNTIISSP